MPSTWIPQRALDSLHAISVEIASLRELPEVYDRALTYCLDLTSSEMGFIILLSENRQVCEVVAVKGFQPLDDEFYERFRVLPVRRSVFGIVIVEDRPHISNDVAHDPQGVGMPPGHPSVRRFLGVPLRVGSTVIGMIGVANKLLEARPAAREVDYHAGDEQLLSTFANQVAVAIENARLYTRQREMITELQWLHRRLGDADRDQILARERQRIAAGLHDHIEQSIFMIGLRLATILEGELRPAVREQLIELRRMVSRTDDEVREVVFALAAPGYGHDLTISLRALLREAERTSGLETNLVVTGAEAVVAPAVQDVLRDVVNEALSNVVKHAEARMVLVSLRYLDDHIDVIVQDDGVGAPELVLQSYENGYVHFGLRHMREMVVALDGIFEAANGDDGVGFMVKGSVPLVEPAT
jgi:signal transduction histidine kinase